ncbi:MAG: hypothetical protein PF447_09380 [Spirochaetaceae bacterium]|jgi:hypothetical protein|nr:hypothetical protein [Spirochaetaceae bacterium]
MSFDCKYKLADQQCRRLGKECSPGDQGCVLQGKVEMYKPEKKKKSPVKKSLISLVLMLLLILASCGIELPVSHYDLAGEWEGGFTGIIINQSGKISYWEKNGTSKKTVEAPLQEIDGNILKIGLGNMTTVIEITRMPWQEDGETWMEINGRTVRQIYDYTPNKGSTK